MREEISSAEKTSVTSNEELQYLNGQLSAHVERLQTKIKQLENELNTSADACRRSEEAGVNKSRLLTVAIHDLRQPLQTLDLLYDALTIRTKDEDGLKLVERLGKAVTTASNTANRISEISRLDAERVDVCHRVSGTGDVAEEGRAWEHSVLLVTDDLDLSAALEFILAGKGYQVSIAADGWQALELSAHGAKWPDLVIADYNLPNGLDGLDVVVSLQDRLDHGFATIILTGDISNSAARAIEGRGYTRLRKPVRSGELTELVQLALAGCHANAVFPSLDASIEEAATVFIVDDDPSVLEAMRYVFVGAGHTVETFATGSAFFAACAADRVGCLLVDALMPDMNGFELIERLRAENYTIPAIMVTGAGDVPMAVRAMKAGAADFIEKPVCARELLDCLQNAMKPAPNEVTALSRQNAAEARFATLTERQRQIMDLILVGEPNKSIAYRLGLSQRTVESHRAAIMRKTGARSFAALVRWAVAAT